MIKQELSDGIVRYIFDPEPKKHFAFCITALIDENKAVLIDAGYEHHALQVLNDLNTNNIVIEKIIITHFHDDHMGGLKVLPKVPVYGSVHYQETLDMWNDKEEHKYFIPSVTIDRFFTFGFGKHRLSLIPCPGHSKCGMLININEQFIHVSDELMFSPDGEPLLPSVDSYAYKRHLESLDQLKAYSNFIIIPSSGTVFSGEILEKEIKNRYIYLSALLNSGGVITYEEAIKGCTRLFLHSEWHKGNCQ